MDKGNRSILAVLVAVVMAAALFSAFSINLFHRTPAVVLPSLEPVSTPPPPAQSDSGFTRVEVDTSTVQQVVASLERPESYTRTVTVETLGRGESYGVTTARVTVDGGWTMVEATLPDRRVVHRLVGDGLGRVWYDSDRTWGEYAAGENSADLAQRLPTYEDVLEADPSSIVAAGYEEKAGLPCIYIAVEEPELGYVESYWVSVDTGLLVHAESRREEELFYTMSGYTVETPAAPGVAFSLPDGTVLHTTALPG